MTADHEQSPSSEYARKASEQSSTLMGVAGFLNNLVMIKPDFGPDDLEKLAKDFQGLAKRISEKKIPLSETDVIGMKAVNIAEKDLNPLTGPRP